ncbi:MAG: hypothetical protein ACPG77_07835 [Nannocystaceae bacterium]
MKLLAYFWQLVLRTSGYSGSQVAIDVATSGFLVRSGGTSTHLSWFAAL